MTLPGGVLFALDPEWDEASVDGFFAPVALNEHTIYKGPYGSEVVTAFFWDLRTAQSSP